ncbi:MAG: hypothetical protein COA50_11920 [Flavobacteriaceae bacterium]|nr:MAG: hypothetical protein COA50_11920 [Flavobacteriaceae bacterium]
MIFEAIVILKKYPFILLYAITLIVAIAHYGKYYDSSLKYFPIILLYTLMNEILGVLVQSNNNLSFFLSDFYINNNWLIYNVYDIIVHLYLFYLFWNSINNENYRKFIVYSSVFYIVASIINPFFQNFILHPQIYAYVLAGLILICIITLYFSNRKHESKSIFGKKDFLSWIGTGLLIFYLGYLPIIIMRHYNVLYNINEPTYILSFHYGLIIVMYTFYIIGFIRMRKLKTSR